MDEFSLIGRYFTRPVAHTVLGVGDDAALIEPTPGCQTVVATDMLVEGVHFFADTAAGAIGHKALAVNLSDLAAMGAAPRQALLGIALPVAEPAWLEAFARGFAALADRFATDWVGGDTTRGPLNLCVTVIGEVPRGEALRRCGAMPGHDLWISGVPGLAALGLAHLRGECALDDTTRAAALARLHTPEPRVALGIALRGVASACIDVSDGVLADLGHLLRASGAAPHGALAGSGRLAAELDWPALAAPLRAVVPTGSGGVDEAVWRRAILSGGDDYELLFAAPAAARQQVVARAAEAGVPVTRIGNIGTDSAPFAAGDSAGHPPPAITLVDGVQRTPVAPAGYLHFG